MAEQLSTQLHRLKEVLACTGLCRSALYQLERSGQFPKRVAIGPRSVAWRSDEIAAWIATRQRKAAA